MTPTQRLRREVLEEQAHRQALENGIRELLEHMASDKFRGDDADGARRDWIATGDVHHRLQATLREGEQARDLEARYRWAILPAADNIDQLRAIDLHRVLEPLPELNLPGFVDWLIAQRPDLGQRIRDTEQALRPVNNAQIPTRRKMEAAQ